MRKTLKPLSFKPTDEAMSCAGRCDEAAIRAATGKSCPARDDGYILIAAVLLLGALAALLTLFTRSVTETRRLAVAMQTEDRLAALASGGARLAALELIEQSAGRPSPIIVGGLAYVCKPPAGDDILHIVVEDEGGKIDLNTASDALIEALLKGAGASAKEAEQLTARIADFRDTDDTPRVSGAEASAYRAAGLRHGPKNAEFESIEELDQILEMPGWLYSRLRPHVTVFNRTSGVDPARISPDLATMLTGTAMTRPSESDAQPGLQSAIGVPRAAVIGAASSASANPRGASDSDGAPSIRPSDASATNSPGAISGANSGGAPLTGSSGVSDRTPAQAGPARGLGAPTERPSAQPGARPANLPVAFISPSRQRYFRILATAISPNGRTFTRDATTALPTQPGAQPTFERWMRGALSVGTSRASSANDC